MREILAAVDQDGNVVALATSLEALDVLMADVECADVSPQEE